MMSDLLGKIFHKHRSTHSKTKSGHGTSGVETSQEECYKSILKELKEDFEQKWGTQPPQTMKLDDFEPIRTVGTGSYGRVILVQDIRRKEETYALKVLSKERIVQKKQVEHTLSERKIQSAISFPFIARMIGCFKDNANLFIVYEYVKGGEMFSHLRRLTKFSETVSRFYAAQIVLIIEYLHNLDIVYRDIKPENILFDSNGYIKLTDFGFAKRLKNARTYTLCGTPEYLAPEVILGRGYTMAVDYWSLGVLIYEMAVGYPPFFADQPMKVCEKIVTGKTAYPSHLGPELKHLLANLLELDLTKRLGNMKHGVDDIKNHPWLSSIDWMAIYKKQIQAPIIPDCPSDPTDSRNYDPYPEEALRESDTELYGSEFAEF